MKITRHAYKRARQRLGLNRKAFKRMVESNRVPEYVSLVIKNNHVVTVKNIMTTDWDIKNGVNKLNKLDLIVDK